MKGKSTYENNNEYYLFRACAVCARLLCACASSASDLPNGCLTNNNAVLGDNALVNNIGTDNPRPATGDLPLQA
jgi:hypothetical protein